MKRKIIIAVYIILICFTLKLIYNIVANSILLGKYDNGEYSESQAKALTYFNFQQKYVANYNYGNILYQNGEYESAIDILTEYGCANKNYNNGHSQKAEQLKKDIQREIDRLKKLQKDNDSSDDNNEEEQTETKYNSESIESKIQDIKEEATKEQRELENQYKNYKIDFNRTEKNW